MSIRSTCEKGFPVYLAEQHKAEMDSSLTLGLGVGTIATTALYILNQKVSGLNLEGWQILCVLPIVTSFAFFPTLFSKNAEDITHKEAFDAVCSKYAEKDEEETDGE